PGRGEAARPPAIDRVKDRAVGAAITPAPVGEARPLPPGGAQGMAAVTVEGAEELLTVRHRSPIALEWVFERPGQRRSSAGKDVLLVAHRGRDGLLPRRHEQCDQLGRGYSVNIHTLPHWL